VAQHPGTVSGVQQLAHQRHSRLLVDRVEGHELCEPAAAPEQLVMPQLEALPVVEGPVFVELVRQEVACSPVCRSRA